MDYLEPMLAKLGYSRAWIEYGVLDQGFLEEQSKQYDISADKNSEHYRFAAFRAFLMTKVALSDALIDRYIRLAQLDEDQVMAQAALLVLVEWPALSDSQLDLLSKHSAFTSPISQHHIERVRLLRQLKLSLITDELFGRCIVSQDATVQRQLVERQDISRAQLELLQERGANMAIRNIAKRQLLKYD